MNKLQSKKGFTLIELVVVIVILGILAMLVIPRVTEYRKTATVKTCVGNIRTIKSAMSVYYASSGHDPADLAALVNGGSGFLENTPKCPAGATYDIAGGKVTHTGGDADHQTAVTSALTDAGITNVTVS
jgi:type IV pilus assembly protein PilA